MKKIIVLVLSLMLVVAFTTGCKKAETPKETKPAEAPAPAPAPAPEQPAPEQAPAPQQPAPEKPAH